MTPEGTASADGNPLERWITEMGMGVDVHGSNYTKAAKRAISDALRHSSLNFFGPAGKKHTDMHVEVRIAVGSPDELDLDALAAEVPYGTVTITPMQGGLDVPSQSGLDCMVIANAAILVSFPKEH